MERCYRPRPRRGVAPSSGRIPDDVDRPSRRPERGCDKLCPPALFRRRGARIPPRALDARQWATEAPLHLVLHACTVDLTNGVVVRADGSAERLTDLELRLLGYLAARPRLRVARDELLQEVWRLPRPGLTRAVDTAVRRLRKKIEAEPGQPDHVRKAHGLGYAFHPLPSAANGPLYGRGAILAEVREAFGSTRLLTLTGPAGVGKSRLAAELGTVCRLSDVRSEAGAVGAIGRALGLELDPAEDPQARFIAALRAYGPRVLVLDDADASREALLRVLPTWIEDSEVRLVLTVRRPLGLRCEQVVRVGPLEREDAIAMLEGHAAAGGRPPTESERALLGPLVDEIDRLPLAIELAARRASVIGLHALRRLIADRLDVLRGEERSLVERMRASWEPLAPPLRDALSACGVFRGGFSLEAAAAVLDLSPADALDRLQALVERSLVQVDDGGSRFGVLRAVRELSPVPAEAVHRHARYFLEHGDHRDRENLSAALEVLTGEHRVRVALRLDAIDEGTAPPAVRLHRLEEVVGGQLPDPVAVEAFVRMGRAAGVTGEHALAEGWLRRGLAAAQRLGDEEQAARIGGHLGTALRFQGRLGEAETVLGAALEAARTPHTAALTLWGLGTVARLSGREDEARAFYLRAARDGDQRTRGLAMESLGVLQRDVNAVAAERCYRQAARALDQAGDVGGSAHARCNLGLLLIDLGRHDEADRELVLAREDAREQGTLAVVALAEAGVALVRALADEDGPTPAAGPGLPGAVAALAEALRAARRLDLAGATSALARAEDLEEMPAIRVVRSISTVAFDPTAAKALLETDGPLAEALRPIALAAIAGRPLPAPPRAARTLRGACLFEVAVVVAGALEASRG